MAEYLTHEQIIEIARKCRDNVERLHGCDRHDFQRDDADAGRYMCIKCGGWISAESAKWYAIGHSHGCEDAAKGSRPSGRSKG